METVDCILFLRADRMAAKACDGRIHVWSMHLPTPPTPSTPVHGAVGAAAPSMQLLACMRVPGGGSSGLRSRVLMSGTPDGSHICVGSSCGDVAVYEAVGGAKVQVVCGSQGVLVRCCGLSHDCRHLVASAGGGG